MTQAFNLSLLANKVNTSGVVDSTALPTSGVTAGSYTVANVTVDDKGRVTAASSTTLPAGGFSNMQVFTSNGTFTVPTGITKVKVTVVGGGGGSSIGDGCGVTGYGGGGGGAAIEIISGLTPGGTVSVTVGGGGAGGSGVSGFGGSGGTSSFGAFCSATGGEGGRALSSSGRQGASGGIGSGGNLNIKGGSTSSLLGGNTILAGVTESSGTISGGYRPTAGAPYGGGAGSSEWSTSEVGAAGVVIVEY